MALRLFVKIVTAVLCAAAAELYAVPVPPGASLIDDCEGGTNQNKFGVFWFMYDDSLNGGNSAIIGAIKGPPFGYIINTAPVAGEGNGGGSGYRMAYKMGTVHCQPGDYTLVGAGTMLAPEGSVLDITGATKITFWAKAAPGVTLSVRIMTSDVVDYDYHRALIAVGPAWTEYTVRLFEGPGGINQIGWGASVPFNPAHVRQIEWQIHSEEAPPDSGSLNLDDVIIHDYKFAYDSVTVTVKGDSVINVLSGHFFGHNYWMWTPTWSNCISGTESKIADLNVKLLRIGGISTDLGYPDPVSDSALSEFMAYCTAVGAEPMLQIQLAKFTNTADRVTNAVKMLTYFKTLYPVKYVSIGNEPDLYSDQLAVTPEYNAGYLSGYSVNDYCNDFNAIATELKKHDPTLTIIGLELAIKNEWIPEFVSRCKDKIDAISLHYYPFNAAQCTYSNVRDRVADMNAFYSGRRALIDLNAGGKRIPLIIGETNITWDGNPANPVYSASPGTFNQALWFADLWGVSGAQKDLLSVMPWCIRETWMLGFLDTIKNPKPVYDIYRLFSNNVKPRMIHNERVNSYVRVYGYKDDPNNVSLFAVNWDTAKSCNATFRFSNILNDSSYRYEIPPHSVSCLTFSSDFSHTTVIVCTDNRPPAFASMPDSVTAADTQTVTWTARAADPDGDKVTYIFGAMPMYVTKTNDSTIRIAPSKTDVNATVRVIASDGKCGFDTFALRIVVIHPVNHSPRFTHLTDTLTLTDTQAVTWTAHAADPDGDKVTYGFGVLPGYVTKIDDSTISLKPSVTDVNATVRITASDGKGGLDTFDLQIKISFESAIALRTGWNMISLNRRPADSSCTTFFGALRGLVLVKDNGGRTYWPAMGVNTMGSVVTGQGYKLYTDSLDTIVSIGRPYDLASTPIPLGAGWNMIAYLPQSSIPIATALSGIRAHITVVKNNDGKIYWPDFSVNSIGSMNPGEGYKAFIKQAASLLYPASAAVAARQDETTADKLIALSDARHYTCGIRSGSNASVLACAITVNGVPAPDGAEVGVFDESGALAGSGVVERGVTAFAVWGKDALTRSKEGVAEGGQLCFKLWDGACEYPIEMEKGERPRYGEDRIIVGTFSVTEAFFIKEFALHSVRVGASGLVDIRFDVPMGDDGKAKEVTIYLYDIGGRRIGTIMQGLRLPGHHRVTWNGGRVPAGMYIVQMKAAGFSRQAKFIQTR